MAKYSEYKDSGVPWIGKVPSHWSSLRAKFIFDRHKRPVRPFDEIVTCFRDGTVTLRKNRRETGFTNALMEFGYQGIRKGDLVVHQMDAFAGSIGVSDSDGKSTPVYTVCTLHDGKSSVWYYAYLLRVMANSDFIQSLSRGIRERSTAFGYDIMGNLLLPIPPVEEQEAIVEYLDKVTTDIDKAIEAKERIIASLEERRKIIITHAVTRGINPDVPMRDSGIDWLGEIPAHWIVLPIKRVAKLILGKMLDNSGGGSSSASYPYLCAKDVHFEGVDTSDLKRMYFTDSEIERYKVKNGDLLVVEGGAGAGGCAIAKEIADDICIQNSIIIVRTNEEYLNEYLSYTIQSLVKRGYIEFACNKATIPHFTKDKLGAVLIGVPNKEEREHIVKYIDHSLIPIDKAIAQQKKLIELLRERKNIIINETVTGKVKVI